MPSSRRGFVLAGLSAVLAGCGSGGFAASSTPPPSAFEVTATDDAVELRYSGVGSQDTTKFRVVLEGAGEADGAYIVGDVTGDSAWSADDRYVLNQSTLGLSAPLSVDTLTVTLEYDDDGDWRPLVRTKPAD